MKLRREIAIAGVLILLAVFLGMSQTIAYQAATPQGYSFLSVHNYPSDYYYYLHVMRQGMEGHFLATSWLTPEQFAPQFVNPLFLVLGHLTRLFGTTLPFMYTAARVVGCMGLFAGVYFLITRIYTGTRERIIALMLAIFAGPAFAVAGGRIGVLPLVHNWTELDPLFRLTYIPHHLWAKVFMVGAFYALLRLTASGKSRPWLVMAGICAVLMGFSSPVAIVTFGLTGIVWVVLAGVRAPKTVLRSGWFLGMVLSGVLALLVAVYHRVVQQGEFPWTSYIQWEQVKYPLPLTDYAFTFGLALLFFVIAIPSLWKRGVTGSLLIAWASSGFLGIALSSVIPLSNIRFLEGYQYLPVSIGAFEGVRIVSERFGKRWGRMVLYGLLAVILAQGLVSMAASWQEHKGYISGNRWNPAVYVPASWSEMFAFLDREKPQQSVVLAPSTLMGNMIPALSGKRAVTGHQMITYQSANKEAEAARFYSYTDEAFMADLIKKYGISYIVTDYRPLPDTVVRRLGVRQVFASGGLAVYRTGTP